MEGYQVPLDFWIGLPFLPCYNPTVDEISSLPNVIMTADLNWDPSKYDKEVDNLEQLYDPMVQDVVHKSFDRIGEYLHRTVATHTTFPEEEFCDIVEYLDLKCLVDDFMDTRNPEMVSDIYNINSTEVGPEKHNFDLLHHLLGWAPDGTIKKKFDVTTQYARVRVSNTLKQHWCSCFAACKVKRCSEPVATDMVFSDTPAVDSGVTATKIFIGRDSLVADCYGLKSDKELVNALKDNIR